jgi:hypothetical protein
MSISETTITTPIILHRGKNWSPNEDNLLCELVNKYGKSWVKIGKLMGNKNNKSCRERWINNLHPRINW